MLLYLMFGKLNLLLDILSVNNFFKKLDKYFININIKIMKFKNQILYFVSILATVLLTISCSDTSEDVVKLPSIVDIAKADPANFSILVDALKKTSLDINIR